MGKRLAFWLVVAVLSAAGLLPILYMLWRSVSVNGHLSLSYYSSLLSSERTWALLAHSITLTTLTTIASTLIGVPLGILLAKTDLPLRKALAVTLTLPLLIPPYINALSWFYILGRDGIIASLMGSAVSNITSAWYFGLGGSVFVLTITFMPVVMLLTMAYLGTINPELEEVGRLFSKWPAVLARITVPMILPGISLAAMLVFLLSMGEFGVPTFLRYDVFPVESFTQFSAFYNFGAATAAAVPLAVITAILISLEWIFVRDRTYRLKTASDNGFLRIKLKRWKRPFLIITLIFAFTTVILPLTVLVARSMTLDAYRKALSIAHDSLLRSIVYAVVGATLLVGIGFLSGYFIHKREFSLWRALDLLTIFLFALPGTVIGVGLIGLWNRPSTDLIYTTPLIILMGYLAKYTALTSRITVSTLAQIPPSMEESARLAGVRWLNRIMQIVVPLSKPGILVAWIVGFIFCLRDLGITIMVYPPGHDTFTVRTFTLMANGSPQLIAALSVMMVAAVLLVMGAGWAAVRILRRR